MKKPSVLLSVPPALQRGWAGLPSRPETPSLFPDCFLDTDTHVDADPENKKLGSGGGTMHLLHQAWLKNKAGQDFATWLASRQRLVIHAGGKSRRLPAYASLGKSLLPVPELPTLPFNRCGQSLLDFQTPLYSAALQEAGEQARLLLASGDVWLDFRPGDLPEMKADLTGVGMRVTPETATHFGVFFVNRFQNKGNPARKPIAFFLQKPSPETIYRYLPEYDFFVDTGLWFLSAQALNSLNTCCGWNSENQCYGSEDGLPGYFDFYGEIGRTLTLERDSSKEDPLAGLSAEVVVPEPSRFFHLGTSRQLFESFEDLQSGLHTSVTRRNFSILPLNPEASATQGESGPTFLDTSFWPGDGFLGGFNLITLLPEGHQITLLQRGQCLDCQPVGPQKFAFRPYHLDDPFQGTASSGASFCGQDLPSWLSQRKVIVDNDTDAHDLNLFPLLSPQEMTQEVLEGFFAPSPSPEWTAWYQAREKISCAEISNRLSLSCYLEIREKALRLTTQAQSKAMAQHPHPGLYQGDFVRFSELRQHFQLQDGLASERELLAQGPSLPPQHRCRHWMMLHKLESSQEASEQDRERAFVELRKAVLSHQEQEPVNPVFSLKEDQIVWARSPVRLDLAGGWTDTPPYCFDHGGSVVNMAVDLNGQPPIQVFLRPITEPVLRIRSIDLGMEEEISTLEQLETYQDPRSGFSLPKAALAIAGFHPLFRSAEPASSLRDTLKAFGSGLELSLLCAVPKGSGLGTSSILAATLLDALNRACGLEWDRMEIYRRVLTMEQLLTTGGGWQDQAGALFPGIKLVQTRAGLSQEPVVRYLPERLMRENSENHRLLLYYTGITRLARNILQDIVTGMFLNHSQTRFTLQGIEQNAQQLFEAFQTGNWESLSRCVQRSWKLNQQLDPGTSTPVIESLIGSIENNLSACKLLGAGGGGYLLIFAKSPEDAFQIRKTLESNPPNPRARFVDFSLSSTGLQTTVS